MGQKYNLVRKGDTLDLALHTTFVGLVGMAICAGITGIAYNYLNTQSGRYNTEAERGYAIPSKLEIEAQDLNGNGQKETLLQYDGKSYLLKVDGDGKPQVLEYNVKNAEVVPR